MLKRFFYNTFASLPVPVIVAHRTDEYPVVFANTSARVLLDALVTVADITENDGASNLADTLCFHDRSLFDALLSSLEATGVVSDFHAVINDTKDTQTQVRIDANQVTLDDGGYFVFYIRRAEEGVAASGDTDAVMATLFQLASQADTVDDAINAVLGYIGNAEQVSRAYIFEEISAEDTSNTYEWCAPGVEPAMQHLKQLKKADYNYDMIVEQGLYISGDIAELPADDYAILAPQGIKSLAILSLTQAGTPLGYVGFDDCTSTRIWNAHEIGLLQNTAHFIVSLIKRRNAERKLIRSREVLQTITDSIENVIYVSDIQNYELVFLNKELADSIGVEADTLIGRRCWETLQRDMQGPCPFCPVPKMLEEGYDKSRQTYTWEFENTVTGRWYLLKDSIIEWIDGRQVHIETATDITHHKRNEERLKQYASLDMMTGAYNREWGHQIMREMIADESLDEGATLLYLDVDGLKQTNDTHGHGMGDEVIIKMVDMVRSCIRKTDIICRWGGDEFLVVLRCNEKIAQRIVHNIYEKLDAYNEMSDKPYRLGFSYGIASLADAKSESLDHVIARADKRMYQNKMHRRMLANGESH